MPGIKEKIENSPVVWMLGTLLTGFIAGISAYKGVLEITNQVTVSEERLKQLEECCILPPEPPPSKVVNNYSVPLPDYLDNDEIERLFRNIKSAYNEQNGSAIYQMFGPLGRAQMTEEVITLNLESTFNNLGKIESSFYVVHQFMGKQGIYRSFALNFSVKYAKAERGVATIVVVDDGQSYQVNGILLNRL